MIEYYDSDEGLPQSPRLSPVNYHYTPRTTPSTEPPSSSQRQGRSVSSDHSAPRGARSPTPGVLALIPEPSANQSFHQHPLSRSPQKSPSCGSSGSPAAMTQANDPFPMYTEPMEMDQSVSEAQRRNGEDSQVLKTPDPSFDRQFDTFRPSHARVAGTLSNDRELTARPKSSLHPERSSAADSVMSIQSKPARRASRPPLSQHLRLKTESSKDSAQEDSVFGHRRVDYSVSRQDSASEELLPALRPRSASHNDTAGSPKAERLPSFRQLSKIADSATEEMDARSAAYANHSAYSASVTGQSPVLSHSHYQSTQQTSPASTFAFGGQTSPTSAHSEMHFAQSPPSAPGNYYAQRRTSMAQGGPPFLNSVHNTSTSGSGESGVSALSHQSSTGTEGYSTAHTTPIDSSSTMDGTPRMLPVPTGMPPPNPIHVQTSFICDFPQCNAQPFATQYLLK